MEVNADQRQRDREYRAVQVIDEPDDKEQACDGPAAGVGQVGTSGNENGQAAGIEARQAWPLHDLTESATPWEA
jgi:hypothetical protein